MEERKVKVSFNRSGGTAKGNAMTNRITIPTNWIRDIGITNDNREVYIIKKDNEIIIRKAID